ncbi:hypothetical protein F4604DRAFT_1508725, partial [Suillus subluteus]
MRKTQLISYWMQTHTETFMCLKTLLLAEPVLKGPCFDGTPFIVTSDGYKDGFGAVLMQRFTTTLPTGRMVVAAH